MTRKPDQKNMKMKRIVLLLFVFSFAVMLALTFTGCAKEQATMPERPSTVSFNASRLFILNNTYKVDQIHVRNVDQQLRITPYAMWEIDNRTGRYRNASTYDVFEADVVVQTKKTWNMTLRGQTIDSIFRRRFLNMTEDHDIVQEDCRFWDEYDPRYPVVHGRCRDRQQLIFISVGGEIDNREMMRRILSLMTS
ncbi:MAG: hypothetical protein GXP63_01075 [DPANN group archaeon]|nr:hypothetical protein [DPANN group archaeon]